MATPEVIIILETGYNFTFKLRKNLKDATLRERGTYVPQHDRSPDFTRLQYMTREKNCDRYILPML